MKDEKVTLTVTYDKMDEVVLTNRKGDTYTSSSEELMDFILSSEEPTPSQPEGETHSPNCWLNQNWDDTIQALEDTPQNLRCEEWYNQMHDALRMRETCNCKSTPEPSTVQQEETNPDWEGVPQSIVNAVAVLSIIKDEVDLPDGIYDRVVDAIHKIECEDFKPPFPPPSNEGMRTEQVLSNHNILGKLNQQGLTAVVKSAMDDYASRVSENKWISVKDKLPEIGQSIAFVVINSTSYRDGKVYGGIYSADGSFSVPGIGFDASHWKPLPQPPKGE